jgi:hypothetical protein
MTGAEIGGYFGLAIPDYGDPFPWATKFQSGRAALRAALEGAKIKRVLLPAYVCDSVIRAVADAGAVAETYYLDDSLYPKFIQPQLPEDGVLLYVNYFGLCQVNVERLLEQSGHSRLIIDNSQALFAPPTAALASIYSVRKFVGAPDGGLLATSGWRIECPQEEDTGSIERMKHLLLRLGYSARAGYPDHLESERTFENTAPLRMSVLTERLLASIDMAAVKRQRRDNFLMLKERLDKFNSFKWTLSAATVPLCYPLVMQSEVGRLRAELIDKNIFVPTYWDDAKGRIAAGTVEYRFTHCCIAVPCDQRYSSSDVSRVADVLISSIGVEG